MKRPSLILGIESSCDETASALVRSSTSIPGDCEILSSVVASQVELHAKFGGIVPEVASRAHVECITRIVERAVAEAGVECQEIDAIAVTVRPGLIGSLLVGLSAAKALALAWEKPLVTVDHLAAHAYAALMTGEKPSLPFVALVASGGHTVLFHVKEPASPRLLGATIDDAAGEAFDKGAAILGLGFPGGPAVEQAAGGGDAKAERFPRSFQKSERLDFSFSGVKTALLYRVADLKSGGLKLHHGAPNSRRRGSRLGASDMNAPLDPDTLRNLAAGYQEAIVDVLVSKLLRAGRQTGVRDVVACGGVAVNNRLRQLLLHRSRRKGLTAFIPPPELCTDNAAMVAGIGAVILSTSGPSALDAEADPTPVRSPRRTRPPPA